MTDTEFFKLDQSQWFYEYVESEFPENFDCTDTHPKNFEFDDVPF